MNLKKAIVATLVVSGMLAALAGPIPAGAEAAQEQQHLIPKTKKYGLFPARRQSTKSTKDFKTKL
ncbi:MAG: hypothetical protein E6230_28645 [Paenibacillus dendritiformis]|nr:hypothetical protein [Paenibacillus dendritiformis]